MTKEILRYLFGREHLARTFWSVIVALAFFYVGVWYNKGKEPSKVFVTNTPDLRDTIVLQIEGQSNNTNKTLEYKIEQLVREVGSIRRYMTVTDKKEHSNSFDNLKSLPLSVLSERPINNVPIEMRKISLIEESSIAQIQIPKYKLPSIVKGYAKENLSSLAKLTLSKTQYRNNEEIIINIELLDPTLIGKICPLIVDVLSKESENRYKQLYNQQFILQPKKNVIPLIADFGIGKLILQAGFYILEELNQPYPPFYSTQIEIEIKK